jgi:hypothetical protein
MIAATIVLLCHTLARADGKHVRLRTPHGPVHVWTPPHHDARTANIVVYVHGFYVDVDEAWRAHALVEQFEKSQQDALFVACEAPGSLGDPVAWESLDGLLAAVRRGLGEELPGGKVTVVGHSGAIHTIRPWFREPKIDTLILVDALYGSFPELRSWLLSSTEHRLIDFGELTAQWTDELHATLPETRVLDQVPGSTAAWQQATAGAQIVYLRSRVGHMELVTGGKVLPMVLAPPLESEP